MLDQNIHQSMNKKINQMTRCRTSLQQQVSTLFVYKRPQAPRFPERFLLLRNYQHPLWTFVSFHVKAGGRVYLLHKSSWLFLFKRQEHHEGKTNRRPTRKCLRDTKLLLGGEKSQMLKICLHRNIGLGFGSGVGVTDGIGNLLCF